MHGVGSSVVNALSAQLMYESIKTHSSSHQEYRRGKVADLKVIGETDRSGTTVHFTPDPEIFTTETTEFDFTKLNKRIQELAFSKP